MSALSGFKRTLGIAFMTQYAELVIQFISVMVLARIITSKEIGIYSVAAFLMAVLHVFRDFGVAKYIIQEADLTAEKIRAAFGVAIILALAVAAVLFCSSGAFARFYHEPQIRSILMVMSASFAITPLGSVLSAIFRREMQLQKVAVVRITSAICQVAVSIVLALLGYGAMSLAWSNFASILSFGLVAMALRPRSIPLMPSFRNIRSILSFGSVASLGSVANVMGTNAPDVIIGKTIGLAATGYFSRANGLVQIFRTIVTGAAVPLVLPYFASLRRENGDSVGAYHLAVAHLTAFAWPFFGVTALLAFPVVRTLYGPNWDASVPVVQVLCVAGAVSTLSIFAGEVMIAHGQVAKVTQMHLMVQPIRVVAILLSSVAGIVGVGAAIGVAECVALAVTSHLLQRSIGARLGGVLRATVKSALVTATSMLFPAFVMLTSPGGSHAWLNLALGGLGAFAGWLAGVVCFHHPLKDHLSHARIWLATNLMPGR